MKVIIDSNFQFEVGCISYSYEGVIKISLQSELKKDDNKYHYATDLVIGKAEPKKSISLSVYINNYVTNATIKEKTRQTYEQMAKHLVRYGDCALDEITTEYLQSFIYYLENCGLQRSTVLLNFQKLSSVLNSAYREGLFDNRILLRVRRPKRQEKKKSFLTELRFRDDLEIEKERLFA